MPINYDIIIVGAGIAGTALTTALGGGDHHIALIEAQPLADQWPPLTDSVDSFDTRVSALTVASQHFLQSLGSSSHSVWQAIAQRRISPYRHMHVWDADGTGRIDFHAADIHQSVLGHIVENRLIIAALLACIREQAGVELICPSTVAAIDRQGTQHVLTLDDSRQLTAPLIVAADGGSSPLREQAGFATRQWDYGHQAIVATVRTTLPHDETAWQRFMPEGPLAFLPLRCSDSREHLCSIVWSVVSARAQQLMALDDDTFLEQLTMASERHLGTVIQVGRRCCFPLHQCHARDYVMPGLALVGDAAHVIHPLAGQGVNLGLQDVRVLAEEIVQGQQRGLSPGDLSVLKRYQKRRKTDNLVMMAAMEGFKRLFEETTLPVRWARNTGMRWLDKIAPLKHRIMRKAMGI